MQWIRQYQLFLFDFDGLLVNTEMLQFQAYKDMCLSRGFALEWSFAAYCSYAHSPDTEALRNAIYDAFPKLWEMEPDWSILYAEKKQLYEELLFCSRIELMPGVARLLGELQEADIRRCVVTNSWKNQTDLIKHSLPLLKTIPHWITREDFLKSKPDPEGYLRAIAHYGKKGDRIIGFEDAPRGVAALLQTPATIVMISPLPLEILGTISNEVHQFSSFEDIPEDHLG
jgi:HAD superfamily hydrolase (TIGR01509 family)